MATEYSENESSSEFLTLAQASALRASCLVKSSLGVDNLSASRTESDAEMSYGEYLVAYLNEKNARPPTVARKQWKRQTPWTSYGET